MHIAASARGKSPELVLNTLGPLQGEALADGVGCTVFGNSAVLGGIGFGG